jgi:hypothetical protein
MIHTFLVVAILLTVSTDVMASDAVPAQLKIFPPRVELNSKRDFQSLVVQASYSDGLTRDVTADAALALSVEGVVAMDGRVARPVGNAEIVLTAAFAGLTASVPGIVKNASDERPISFKLDVMPVFTKAGCNSGDCHGASRGQDGFRLSLFGYDPDGDYLRLTRQAPGRRLNLASSDRSLFIQKALGSAPHTGGKRLDEGLPQYRTIMRWLEAGAPADGPGVAQPVSTSLYPEAAVLASGGAEQQFVVVAHYSDGSDRDVTGVTKFLSNNDNAATISEDGLARSGARGEAFVMARFDAFTVGAHLIVVPPDAPADFPNEPETNYIDALINRKLRKLRITPSAVCSDEVFLRRAHLDIVGLSPTVEEHRRFLENPSADKRTLLIDELLNRKEFVELWVMKWAELLQIRSSDAVSYKAMLRYYDWLQEKLAGNTPVDEMVRELLSATGGVFSSPATNYYQNETDTLKTAENIAQVFLGTRLQCAQCHNHPFDRWKQDDYYGFAAFFSQIGRKPGADPRETIVFNRGSGDVSHPVSKRVMPPKFLGGPVAEINGRDRRVVLAEWLASRENKEFSRNLANIVWAHFFGRGIVHEVDDVRVSNPPSNPQLLSELAKQFRESGFDLRKLVRDICTSRAYQRSTKSTLSNASDTRNFARATVRRIRAELLNDVISRVTETKDKFKGLPLGARAVQISDGTTTSYFLKTFGRASRKTVCSCEVKMEPTLSQALHLLNGETVHGKIVEGGLIARRIAAKATDEQIIEELYIRCLSRRPTAEEAAGVIGEIESAGDRGAALEDVFWALLNSHEFLFNH